MRKSKCCGKPLIAIQQPYKGTIRFAELYYCSDCGLVYHADIVDRWGFDIQEQTKLEDFE